MGGGKSKAVRPCVAPALSIVLALAAFWLAWRYGWPWGAFLLAEVLALMALAVALWRTEEGYPWWAYPALLVSLVVLVFSWLYLSKKPDLAGAVQAGSAVVLAFFTITLWRSTHAQAEATKRLASLESLMVKAEVHPLLFAERAQFSSEWVYTAEGRGSAPSSVKPASRRGRLALQGLVNLGKYGVVVREVNLCSWDPEVRNLELHGRALVNLSLLPGQRLKEGVEVTFKNGSDFLGSLMFDSFSGGHIIAFVAFRVVYGGNPETSSFLCFRLVPSSDVASGDGDATMSLQPWSCPEGTGERCRIGPQGEH